MATYRFEGHAIVSRDDMIADADGKMPAALLHAEDQRRFQAALDRAALIILGRRSHEAVPNRRGRLRMVMTRSVAALERANGAWWWNPEGMELSEALELAAPGGGTIAVPGGQGPFDHFLQAGFDAFHLSRRDDVALPGGVPLFSACGAGTTADDVLADAGLVSGDAESLGEGVTLTTWRRPADER